MTTDNAILKVSNSLDIESGYIKPKIYKGTVIFSNFIEIPRGGSNHWYSWQQIGSVVNFNFQIEYEKPGRAVAAIELSIPPDMPKPREEDLDINNMITGRTTVIATAGSNKRKTLNYVCRSFIKKTCCKWTINTVMKKGNYSRFMISGFYKTQELDLKKQFKKTHTKQDMITFAKWYRKWYGHPRIIASGKSAYEYWINIPRKD